MTPRTRAESSYTPPPRRSQVYKPTIHEKVIKGSELKWNWK